LKEAHQQWHVITHHQLDDVRECSALGEVDEVLQAESQVDMLVHLNAYTLGDVVIVIFRFTLLGLFGWLVGRLLTFQSTSYGSRST
jgi:hypothetical protein